jgi:hypothetical protein
MEHLEESARVAEIRANAAEQEQEELGERIEELEASIKHSVEQPAYGKDDIDVSRICKAVEELKQLHIAEYAVAKENAKAEKAYDLAQRALDEEKYIRRLAEKGLRIKPNWDGSSDEWEDIGSGTGYERKYKRKGKQKTKKRKGRQKTKKKKRKTKNGKGKERKTKIVR